MIKLGNLFNIQYGHSLELNRLKITTPDSGFPFVSRKMGDNGIAAYVEEVEGVQPNPAGELTCALSGNGVLSTFIQERPYYTGFHIACLCPKTELPLAQLLFYCGCIHSNRYRYSWGRQANRTLRDILIPSPDELPLWVNELSVKVFDNKDAPAVVAIFPPLGTFGWQPFRLSQLFEVQKGKRLTKANMTAGSMPFIGAVDGNNGISASITAEPHHPSNTLTVSYNGSVGEAFYQPKPYRCSDDVNVLYPKFSMTPAIGLFIATVIRQEKYRFNYGRKWHSERMAQSEIRLPVDAKGDPDWPFIESYIKTLPFSSQL